MWFPLSAFLATSLGVPVILKSDLLMIRQKLNTAPVCLRQSLQWQSPFWSQLKTEEVMSQIENINKPMRRAARRILCVSCRRNSHREPF
jgi:hypothetical protein